MLAGVSISGHIRRALAPPPRTTIQGPLNRASPIDPKPDRR